MKVHAVETTVEPVTLTAKEISELERLDKKYLKRQESWIGKVEDIFYWPVRRFIIRVSEVPENLVAFYQRGKRGYADSDAWGVDDYLNSFMPELLRRMIDKEQGGGWSYPGIAGDPNCDTMEHWKATVEKMARGFEASREQEELWGRDDIKDHKQHKKVYDSLEKERIDGMKLFTKYYSSLWD